MINALARLALKRKGVSMTPLIISLFILLISGAVSAAPPSISPDALRLLVLTKPAGLTIVDVRPPSEFDKSHIQGAVNVPAAVVSRAGLDRKAHIVVYCSEAVCPLSTGAANQLIADGYPKVELLDGGFDGWIGKGYPVQSASSAPAARPKNARTTTKEARAEMRDGSAIVLDVRSATEFTAGHIPSARSAPLEKLDSEMLRLPKGSKFLIYDLSAARSRAAQEKLAAAGFNVSELSGGLAGWVRRGNGLTTKN